MYTQLKKEGAKNRSYETPKLEDLKSEYQIISLKLLECAQHVPGEDISRDQEMEQREERLLSTQDDILETIATLEITSQEEADLLLDLWAQVEKSQEDPAPSSGLMRSIIEFNARRARNILEGHQVS